MLYLVVWFFGRSMAMTAAAMTFDNLFCALRCAAHAANCNRRCGRLRGERAARVLRGARGLSILRDLHASTRDLKVGRICRNFLHLTLMYLSGISERLS